MRVFGKIRNEAASHESEALVERFCFGPRSIEVEHLSAFFNRNLFDSPHQFSRDASAAIGRVHQDFTDVGPVSLIGRHRQEKESASYDSTVCCRGHQTHTPCFDLRQDFVDPETSSVLSREWKDETDACSVVDRKPEDLGKLFDQRKVVSLG